jgi:hypothetical protein
MPAAAIPAGFFTSNKYAGWILRSSYGTLPGPKQSSSAGIFFVVATTSLPEALA